MFVHQTDKHIHIERFGDILICAGLLTQSNIALLRAGGQRRRLMNRQPPSPAIARVPGVGTGVNAMSYTASL